MVRLHFEATEAAVFRVLRDVRGTRILSRVCVLMKLGRLDIWLVWFRLSVCLTKRCKQ